MIAAFGGYAETVATLLANGADVNARDIYGRKAMNYALDTDKFYTLLASNTDVNTKTDAVEGTVMFASLACKLNK